MIDPTKITNYNIDKYELEEMILFWLMVAGKNAKTTSRLLEKLLQYLCCKTPKRPFEAIRKYTCCLEKLLKDIGFGCSTIKARGICELVSSRIDLFTCDVEDLEKIYGIGPKTARCFIIHTRAGARYAGLDTHVLKWLASLGHEVPKSTPTGKAYLRLEQVFLGLADKLEMPPAELDLTIWNAYSTGGQYKVNLEV